MKLKLVVTKKIEQEIKEAIQSHSIEFSDDASIVVYELHKDQQFLLVKDQEEYLRIAISDIIYIESIGNMNLVHTQAGSFQIKDAMYRLEADLYEKGFLRVHKAYIVNKKDIHRIKASINMKFTLILSNQAVVEVSRSYYYQFKEEMGF